MLLFIFYAYILTYIYTLYNILDTLNALNI